MKLYITDLDGTLLNHKAQIDSFTTEILNREIKNGINFTFATARSIHSALPILKNLNLNLPVITQNGAFIVDPITQKQLVTHYFNNNQKNFIREYFAKNKEEILVYSYIDGEEKVSYIKETNHKGIKRYLKDRQNDKRLNPCNKYDELFNGEIYYITLISPVLSKEQLDLFFDNKNDFARNYQPDTYVTDEYWYEIYRGDVSKANAIIELKNMLNADEIIVFGDNVNDLSMFKIADRCYSVENALPELKKISTGVIRSNEQGGVSVFIAEENNIIRTYAPKPFIVEPDKERFAKSISMTRLDYEGIGTLNEKQVHAVLKTYFSEQEIDKEIKIGRFYADLVTENGIFEIQTRNFKKLIPKLDKFLQSCHVTVVYPFHKYTRLIYTDENTGEILKTGNKITHNNLDNFWLELYRIKQFLNNENLTICIADLSIDKFRTIKNDLKQRKSDKKYSSVTELHQLTYLENSESYRMFIPDKLNELFTLKDLKKLYKFGDANLFVKIMIFLGIVDYHGKKGNEYIYKLKKYDNKY